MKMKTLSFAIAFILLAAFAVWTETENAGLRRKLAALEAQRAADARRPKMKLPPRPPRQNPLPKAERIEPINNKQGADATPISEDAINEAVKARIEARRREAEADRERRREAIASMTPEQKAAQKDAFLEKMRERSQRRLKAFVAKTGLNESQTAAFENTVAAMDATLRETANAWAEQIKKTGTFPRDAQVKFAGDVSAIISAGYGEMDATLPEAWRTEDGDVNLMEIIGPEALSPIVEALTENGLEDGLKAIGQVMGGPEGGPGGEDGNGEGPAGMSGIESPGVGGGPGSACGPGGATGRGGMGGLGGGFAPPAGR